MLHRRAYFEEHRSSSDGGHQALSTKPVSMSGKGAKGLSGKGAKGTMGDKKGDKKKPVSRSARAGLQFPVGRIHRLLKACVLLL